MKSFLVALVVLLVVQYVVADGCSSSEYYSGINSNLRDGLLKTALQKLLYNHKQLAYDQAWDAFKVLDRFLPGMYNCMNNSVSSGLMTCVKCRANIDVRNTIMCLFILYYIAMLVECYILSMR